MELLATGNSTCCPDLLYGDVSGSEGELANTEPLNNTLNKKVCDTLNKNT